MSFSSSDAQVAAAVCTLYRIKVGKAGIVLKPEQLQAVRPVYEGKMSLCGYRLAL